MAPKDEDIRSRILTIMEQVQAIILQKVTEECLRLMKANAITPVSQKKNLTCTKDKTAKSAQK